MKKQIIYPKLVPRVFASMLDLFILTIVATPITTFISSRLLIFFFKDYFIINKIDLADNAEVNGVIKMTEFFQYMISNDNFFYYISVIFLLNTIIMGSYFIGFWIYKGATPGKMLMHMKIVDAITFEQPTKKQFFIRFFGYITVFFGIWVIAFSKKRQALHDKSAGTVVIKS